MTAIADASRNADVVTSTAASTTVTAGTGSGDHPGQAGVGVARPPRSRQVTRSSGDAAAVADTDVADTDVAEIAETVDIAAGSRAAVIQALEERNRALKLIDSGHATMARVDEVCDTGLRVNGRPVAEVRLLVDCPGRSPYRVTRRAVVPDEDQAVEAPAVSRIGRRIPVLVDPGHPENVLLRWDLRVAS